VFFNKSGKWSIEKIDDYVFTLTFAKPNALLEEKIAAGYQFFIAPAHYAKQFHIDYNPDADTLAKEAGFDDWAAQFKEKTQSWLNPECPVLSAWAPKNSLQGSSQFIVERNSYYWKTDSQGNQLPYIDRIVFHNYKDIQSVTQKTLNGEIDFMDRTTIATIQNKSAFAENQAAGNYRLISISDPTSNKMAIILNQTAEDPVMRELFRNKDFRIGLSLAINRQEIIDTVYEGAGEPWQTSPRKGSGFYNEQLAKQYTEYDIDLANQYLDEAGLADRDSDGWRIGVDGQRIELEVISRKDQSEITETMKQIVPAWREVGIFAMLKPLAKSEWKTLRDTNQAESIIAGSTGGWTNVVLNPSMHITTSNAPWGTAWTNWYNNVKKGDNEEPLSWVKQGLALYDKVLSTLDETERSQLMQQILELSAENFPVIGIALPDSGYGIVSNRLRNVPEAYLGGCTYAQPAASNMIQFFLEGGSQVALGK
jgi:peptide/nickel transport system substrate-binding protein